MFNLYLSLLLIIGLIAGTLFSTGQVSIFIDLPSFLIVFVGAILYSLASGGDNLERIDNLGYGAIRMGWIGFIIGIIFITSNGLLNDIEKLGPAFGVALITIFYGYIIQLLTNMVAIRIENNRLEEEVKEL